MNQSQVYDRLLRPSCFVGMTKPTREALLAGKATKRLIEELVKRMQDAGCGAVANNKPKAVAKGVPAAAAPKAAVAKGAVAKGVPAKGPASKLATAAKRFFGMGGNGGKKLTKKQIETALNNAIENMPLKSKRDNYRIAQMLAAAATRRNQKMVLPQAKQPKQPRQPKQRKQVVDEDGYVSGQDEEYESNNGFINNGNNNNSFNARNTLAARAEKAVQEARELYRKQRNYDWPQGRELYRLMGNFAKQGSAAKNKLENKGEAVRIRKMLESKDPTKSILYAQVAAQAIRKTPKYVILNQIKELATKYVATQDVEKYTQIRNFVIKEVERISETQLKDAVQYSLRMPEPRHYAGYDFANYNRALKKEALLAKQKKVITLKNFNKMGAKMKESEMGFGR